jgi:hypothetical protein
MQSCSSSSSAVVDSVQSRCFEQEEEENERARLSPWYTPRPLHTQEEHVRKQKPAVMCGIAVAEHIC